MSFTASTAPTATHCTTFLTRILSRDDIRLFPYKEIRMAIRELFLRRIYYMLTWQGQSTECYFIDLNAWNGMSFIFSANVKQIFWKQLNQYRISKGDVVVL